MVIRTTTERSLKKIYNIKYTMSSDFLSNIPFVFSEKIVQISIISGVLFYIVAHPVIFKFVESAVKEVFSCVGFTIVLKGENLLIFHSLVFAVLMGLSTKYLFSRIINKFTREGFDEEAYNKAEEEDRRSP